MANNRGRRDGPDTTKEKEPAVSFKSVNWNRLFGYLRPYRGRMGLAILTLLVYSGLGLAFPLVIVKMLGSVTRAGDYGPLNLLAGVLVVMFLLQSGFSFFQSYLLSYIGERIVYDLRTSLYRHLQALSLDFYANRRVGDLVSRLSSDVTQMRTVLTNNLTMLLSQVVGLTGSIAILLTLNASFTLFILGLVPVLIAVGFVFGNTIRKRSTRIQDQLADSTVVAEEGLQGIRVVKSFGREDYETRRYDGAMEKTFRASLQLAVSNSLFGSVMMFLGFAAIGAIMWYGGREVIAGHLSLAMITGFLIYGISIAASVGGLAGLYGQLSIALGGVQRVFELLDTAPTVQDAPGARAIAACQGRLAFEGVSFSYDGQAQVLQDISLDVHAGEILALVGPSGAGKSTLFNLIPRFYDPTAGRVLADGIDLRQITLRALRGQIGIVAQDTILFSGTVRDNMLYGKPDASDEELLAVARAAHVEEFVADLPEGYDTLLGERGTKLSGGQRQRIAIARAFLIDPRILILDEATSALDSESERLIQDALARLMRDRTSVIIAHRLSTVLHADRIVVMDDGRIVQVGPHTRLIEQEGLYRRLYETQFRAEAQRSVVTA